MAGDVSVRVLVLAALAALAALVLAPAVAASHGGRHEQAQHAPRRGQDRHQQPAGQVAVVKEWAKRIGRELNEMASEVTRHQKLQDNFKKANIEMRDAEKILETTASRLRKLMKRRVEQVQRLREAAELLSEDSPDRSKMVLPQPYLGVKDFETTEVPTPPPTKKPSRWARTTKSPPTTPMVPTQPPTTIKPWLTRVDSFPVGELINVSLSAVHVPAPVYDGRWINLTIDETEINSTGAEVQQVIELTEDLDEVFHQNWLKDKSTSWQFFAHHTGVMRQYPASKWKTLYHEDFYDARLRPWYLGAATSAKEMVILLDNSGSIKMTEPSKLTKLVVNNLLYTLGPDDFVSVLLFSEHVRPLLPGLNVTLIPATSAYVRELQHALEYTNPKGVANLSQALETAFRLLEKYRRDDLIGASCNQAVMLVTDVVPEHAEDLFREHNRPMQNQPLTHARVFTFVIRDGAQAPAREAQWMACANMGWHMDIWNYEADSVIKYVPVMSRPLILAGEHPVHWSHMYADVTVPGMTDLQWANMERNEQLRKLTPFCFKHAELHPPSKKHKLDRLPIEDVEFWQREEFVITVSMPARNLSVSGMANGDLLGVAGIDVPLTEILNRIPHHQVGANAYVFMVTNNGMVVSHPDLRPLFNGILKPGFNSVDMTEIEMEDVPFQRNMSNSMRKFRELVVSQTTGYMALSVRKAYDNWHRVSPKASRRFWFRGVDNSPYSLVLAAPQNYSTYRIKAPADRQLKWDTLRGLLGKSHWAVHPNWRYCGYCCGVNGAEGLPLIGTAAKQCERDADDEDVRGMGLSASRKHSQYKKRGEGEEEEHPMELASALASDAETTRFWTESVQDWDAWDRWDVSVAFMATHSGLTRWLTRRRNVVPRQDSPAAFKSTRGPEELWYRRAVEEGMEPGAEAPHWVLSVRLADEEKADVYSEYNGSYDPDDPWAARRAGLADSWTGVPPPNRTLFERAEEVGAEEVVMSAMVTAKPRSSSEGSHRVPAAVAGLRFPQDKLHQLFALITSTLMCPGQNSGICAETCASDSMDCYLLDESAIVVADKTGAEAGRPLARVNADLLMRLERANVFQRITVNDHQGVCRRPPMSTATALAPSSGACWAGAALAALWWGQAGHGHGLLGHGLAPTATALLLGGARGILGAKLKDASTTPEYKLMLRQELAPLRVNKTILHLCVMKKHLHRVGPGVQTTDNLSPHHRASASASPSRLSCEEMPFVAVAVPGTNLVLVVVNNTCPRPEQMDPFRPDPFEDAVTAENPVVRKEGLLWPRRRPTTCFRQHESERNITLCGGAARRGGLLAAPLAVILVAVVVVAR